MLFNIYFATGHGNMFTEEATVNLSFVSRVATVEAPNLHDLFGMCQHMDIGPDMPSNWFDRPYVARNPRAFKVTVPGRGNLWPVRSLSVGDIVQPVFLDRDPVYYRVGSVGFFEVDADEVHGGPDFWEAQSRGE